uniref:ERVV2 protein n=1 Tax=Calidris pygmaea TaxID=425635 RepID=A0A8C3JU16_9CHAR
KRFGHWKNECPEKQKNQEKGRKNQKRRSGSPRKGGLTGTWGLYPSGSTVVHSFNLSDCWVCTALPRANMELPLLGIPISYRNWSWPYSNLHVSTSPTGDNLHWKPGGDCAPGQSLPYLPHGETLCWSIGAPKGHKIPKYTCGNRNSNPLKFELQILERPIFIKRHNNTAPKVGVFNLSITADLNGIICERGKSINDNSNECPPIVTRGLWLNYSYNCIPNGLWWLCGDGRARKSLPDFWDGVCTLGYVIPQHRIYNHSHPPPGIRRTHWWRKRRIPNNPLVDRPMAFHSFARFIPWLGVSELEKAVINISASLEKIENFPPIQGLQTEVSSLSKVVLQNRMALDLLLASQGGVCAMINTSCCAYVDQSGRVATDIKNIRDQIGILHDVTQDDVGWGFFEVWKKLTSWLPNLKWWQVILLCSLLKSLGSLSGINPSSRPHLVMSGPQLLPFSLTVSIFIRLHKSSMRFLSLSKSVGKLDKDRHWVELLVLCPEYLTYKLCQRLQES